MPDPFDDDPRSGFDAGAARAKDDLNHRFQDLRRGSAAGAGSAAESVGARYREAGGSGPGAGMGSTFRRQASQAADEARGAATSIAGQARARLDEIVGQQKAAGAAKIAGVAKAAHSAAGDLDGTNPQLARLVRNAAEGVDRVADDVRSRDVGDIVATLADFGRRQPVAFFGGAVVAGFLLARFFRSDAPVVDEATFTGGRSV